jgi:hypothetical protein
MIVDAYIILKYDRPTTRTPSQTDVFLIVMIFTGELLGARSVISMSRKQQSARQRALVSVMIGVSHHQPWIKVGLQHRSSSSSNSCVFVIWTKAG